MLHIDNTAKLLHWQTIWACTEVIEMFIMLHLRLYCKYELKKYFDFQVSFGLHLSTKCCTQGFHDFVLISITLVVD